MQHPVMQHPALPPEAKPLAPFDGALVATLPPNQLDDPQHVLIENNPDGMILALVLAPTLDILREWTEEDYIRIPQTPEMGARITHLIDLLAELKRRAPALVQLQLVNFTGDL